VKEKKKKKILLHGADERRGIATKWSSQLRGKGFGHQSELRGRTSEKVRKAPKAGPPPSFRIKRLRISQTREKANSKKKEKKAVGQAQLRARSKTESELGALIFVQSMVRMGGKETRPQKKGG